jgi:hypothetical protein
VLHFLLPLAVVIASTQTPPPSNPSCAVLTPAQVSSLIGTARTLPMTAAPNGSTCMFQNENKVITVLMATVSTADAAQGLFTSKKRIASGTDVQGWGVPAYVGVLKPSAAVVGVLKNQTLTEVKVIDSTQAADALSGKLQAAMKEYAGRK